MKKSLLTLLVLAATALRGAGTPVERIYVSTDRDVYIAGDAVWCSLTCLDRNGRFSNASAVSYLELISEDGTACTAKIGLLEGRGAGSFRIPVTAPTGVYRLIAYTAVNAAEEGTPWQAGSRLLTVFNTTSAARVKDGVDIVEESAAPAPQIPAEGSLELSMRNRLRKNANAVLYLRNPDSRASVSLSVHHVDDLAAVPQENSPESFLKSLSAPARFLREVAPENDGEIISARIMGTLVQGDDDVTFATLSTAGSPSNLYVGRSEGDRIRFYTANIYGNREIVCEVEQLDRKEGYIDLESPFIHPAAGDLPKLGLHPDQRADLAARKAALRGEGDLRIDTLTTYLAHREDLLLSSVHRRRYHLDDYTRFPSVREVLVEILQELHLKREKGKTVLELTVSDALNRKHTRTDKILVMMDGVVVSDLDLILGFDAMLLEDVDIYDQSFFVGKTPFQGLVNFITRKNYVTALRFPANVRVVDFQGVAYPVAYGGDAPDGEGQDLRQLLYWHPVLDLDAASECRLEFTTPGYAGRFRVVAEGFTEDGTPLRREIFFEVE